MLPSIRRRVGPVKRDYTCLKLVLVSLIILLALFVFEKLQDHAKSSSGQQATKQQTSKIASTINAQRQARHDSAHLSAEVHDAPSLEAGAEDEGREACHTEPHSDYHALRVVKWGSRNIQSSAKACCQSCQAESGCNVWVFCDAEGGCGQDRQYGECWLKHNDQLDPLEPQGQRHENVPWTSGALYSNAEFKAFQARKDAAKAAMDAHRAELRADESLPLVYLDVSIKGEHIGRMEFVLFTNTSPRAAENFRALCTGEKGIVPEGREGAGLAYHFKDKYFYRIIDQFIDQTGAGTESVFGGHFKDDSGGLKLKHTHGGLLSMANNGPDTNGSHFSIIIAPAHHLDGSYTIFGELVSGWDVALKINALSKGKPNNTAGMEEKAQITDSGQLRAGDPGDIAKP